jgi:hypothetical protein
MTETDSRRLMLTGLSLLAVVVGPGTSPRSPPGSLAALELI